MVWRNLGRLDPRDGPAAGDLLQFLIVQFFESVELTHVLTLLTNEGPATILAETSFPPYTYHSEIETRGGRLRLHFFPKMMARGEFVDWNRRRTW